MKPNRVAADLAREEDIDRILELNKLEYGPLDMLATRADFAWRHDQNPAGRAIIVVIRDGSGEVVGFIWVVPLRVCVKGRDYPASTGTNLVIHPEHRNTFGYTKLIRRFQQVFKDNNIPLHFSFVSEKIYLRQRKQTPQAISTVPLLVKVLDFESLAHVYFTKKWEGFIIGGAGRVASRFFFRQQPVTPTANIALEVVDQFDQEFDEFWLKVRDKYPVMVIRDQAFLTWRFAGVSGRSYRILLARTGDQMLGYAVLRCSTIRGVKTGLVMDLLVTDGVLGETVGACLMAEAEAYFRAQEMSVAVGLMTSLPAEYRILRRAGYQGLPRALAPRAFRFAFVVHDSQKKDLVSLSARDWYITLADYESF
jgi:hypothetical protein